MPIIVAVITAIVSPFVVPMIRDLMNQNQNYPHSPPTQEPSPAPPVSQVPGLVEANITVQTDKQSYVAGETFKIYGTVGKPEFGKVVRIDVYRPDGTPLPGANGL